MAKKKTAHAYELELRKMIKSRTCTDCEPWLTPQIRATANTEVILDKLQEEILNLDTLVRINPGSTKQMKYEIDPRLPYYDKMQRTQMLQYEALGLNYKTTPSKVTENTKKGGEKQDALRNILEDLR